MNATLFKKNSRAGYQIFHRTGHEYFTRFSFVGNAHTHLSRRSGDLALDDFTLAGMKTGAGLHAEP